MSILLILGLIAVVLIVAVDVFAVRRDGYGSTPPPASHEDGELTPAAGRRFF